MFLTNCLWLVPCLFWRSEYRRLSSLAPRTLRDFLAAGYTVTASCSNYGKCSHNATLSLPVLIQRMGWDYSIYADRLD